MKPICIYHANCADGFAAATVIYNAYGDACEFHAAQYGEAPPDCHGREVIIVDFSYKREVMRQLIEQARYVTVLDHHASAERELEGLASEYPDKTYIVFDMTRSGAALAWDYCNPNDEVPLLIKVVQDRDLWKFELPGTKEITTALFSYDFDFRLWKNWLLDNSAVSGLIKEGCALLRKHDKDVNKLVESAFDMVIAGYSVPAVNANYLFASDLGNILAKNKPFACVFTLQNVDGKTMFRASLRSDKDSTTSVDVSEIAEQFGGGGHKHAAGFEVPLADVHFK